MSCPEDKKNQFVNFPPIMRKIGITNSKRWVEKLCIIIWRKTE
jgi:hypothetical protein